jgi:hypothetical protein
LCQRRLTQGGLFICFAHVEICSLIQKKAQSHAPVGCEERTDCAFNLQAFKPAR